LVVDDWRVAAVVVVLSSSFAETKLREIHTNERAVEAPKAKGTSQEEEEDEDGRLLIVLVVCYFGLID
jgi:hypothetical protein